MMKQSFSVLFFFSLLFHGYIHAQEKNVWPDIALEPVVKGLTRPTFIHHAGDGTGSIFITEQKGTIRIARGGTLIDKPFLDITGKVGCCGERGLLSIAFPPGSGTKGFFFVSYTDKKGRSVISRFMMSDDGTASLPESESVLLTLDQPFSNHNGGQIAFGPEGFLYIGFGDGGSAGDPLGSGQDRKSLLGKILRVDVLSPNVPYRVPPDNPFIKDSDYRKEIWAFGLRNPWRFSFDRKNGDLYIADVGQNDYEEIDYQPGSDRGGGNYGWNIMEASHCFRSAGCSREGLTNPIAEYDHSEGCSVTGGYVYRGKRYSALQGFYFFGDYCSGRIWGIIKEGSSWEKRLLLDSDLAISTFGEDEDGEIYVADYRGGTIYRLVDKRK